MAESSGFRARTSTRAGSIKLGVLDLARDPQHGVDEPDVTVRLREVSPLPARLRIDVLAEETDVVRVTEERLELLERVLHAAHRGEGLDVPEGTDEERRRRLAEV